MCNAFGAGEVEDCDPPVAPLCPPQRWVCSGRGSTAAAHGENNPRTRALHSSGSIPTDTAGTGRKRLPGEGVRGFKASSLLQAHVTALVLCSGDAHEANSVRPRLQKRRTPRGAASSRRPSDPDCPRASPVLLPCAQLQ